MAASTVIISTGPVFSGDVEMSAAPNTFGIQQGLFKPSAEPIAFTFNPYHRESIRLQSFKNWPVPFMQPSQLAAAGFYYLNQNNDLVQCAFCGVLINNWVVGDDAFQDHQKWSPDCKFVKKLPCGNIPMVEVPATTQAGPNPLGTVVNFPAAKFFDFRRSNAPAVMSDEEAKETVHKILPKFIAYRDIQVIQDSLNEKFSTEGNIRKFLHYSIVYSLEKYDHHEIIAPLFANLLDVKYNDFTPSYLADRFHEIISCAEDFIMMYPKFWETIAKILAHMLTSETFDFGHLKLSCGSILKYEIRKHLFSLIFQNLSSWKQPAWIRLKWKKSKVTLNQFLPDDYINTFITDNKLDYLVNPKAVELVSNATTPSFDDCKTQLLGMLKLEDPDDVLNSVVDWHNVHFGSPPYTSSFIKPLVSAIFDLCVVKETIKSGWVNPNRSFEPTIMDSYHGIISHFVTPDASLQRHCICALATMMTEWEPYKGAAVDILSYLLRLKLISAKEFENFMSIEKEVPPEFIPGFVVVHQLQAMCKQRNLKV